MARSMPTRARLEGRSFARMTIVTSAARAAKMRANSMAMMPPPMTTTVVAAEVAAERSLVPVTEGGQPGRPRARRQQDVRRVEDLLLLLRTQDGRLPAEATLDRALAAACSWQEELPLPAQVRHAIQRERGRVVVAALAQDLLDEAAHLRPDGRVDDPHRAQHGHVNAQR